MPVKHIIFGHIRVPLAGTTAQGIAYIKDQACSHRFITELDLSNPWWTGGLPCYCVIKLDEHGLRAYNFEVGQVPTSQAEICAGL